MIFSGFFSSKLIAQWQSLIFAPGKYLTLIFLFLETFFAISPDIVESLKVSVVPFLHSSLFYFTELFPAVLIVFVGIYWIFFLVFTCSLECSTVCPTSVTRQFIYFEMRGNSCLQGLSITTLKSTLCDLLEKPSTASLLTDISNSQITRKGLFFCYGFS